MKKLILCILLALFCITSYAEVKREGDTFKVEQTAKASDTQTKYTWEDKEGNKYPIYITKRGACYVSQNQQEDWQKSTNKYLPKDVQAQIKQELGTK